MGAGPEGGGPRARGGAAGGSRRPLAAHERMSQLSSRFRRPPRPGPRPELTLGRGSQGRAAGSGTHSGQRSVFSLGAGLREETL